ncbi:S41 family peptidase, partial [Oleiphilus sp. HI0067]
MNLNLLRALIITITAYSAVSFADDTSSPENTTNTESGTPSEAVAKDDNSENAQPDPLPLNDLRKFADVFGKIKAAYVEEIDDQTLIKHAIRGMLNGLDPHSSYLEPVAYDDLKQNTSGSFGGLGIEVGM